MDGGKDGRRDGWTEGWMDMDKPIPLRLRRGIKNVRSFSIAKASLIFSTKNTVKFLNIGTYKSEQTV